MNFHVELWDLLKAGIAVIGAYFALVKVIVWQFNRGLDARFDAQEKLRAEAAKNWNDKFDRFEANHEQLERRFNEHLQTLPEKYQRREDAIRQEVAIINRLDGVAVLVEERTRHLDEKIEALRR